MRILVTGGAGFIGSNFIRYWLKNYPNDEILNFDKLTYAGHLSSTKDFENNKNYKFVKGDIGDPQELETAIKGAETIVNFAAETHVDRSIIGPKTFLTTNVLGTQVLLDAALKHKIKHFHHVSTDEVFGALPLNSKEKFNEKTLYDPSSPYSASKAASDHLVRSYFYTYDLPITITNCSNNFGPFQDPEKFFSRMITDLIDGKQIKIYGDGKYVRDWLFVEDHVRAIDLVLKKGELGGTYLVGGMTEDVNNLEVADKILEAFGKDKTFIKFVPDRPGHDRRYAVDWSKIRKELGWRPEHNFDEWLVKTINWYRKNEWWWRPLKEEAEKLYKELGR